MTSPRLVLRQHPLAAALTVAGVALLLIASLVSTHSAAQPQARSGHAGDPLASRLASASALAARPSGGSTFFGPNRKWSSKEAKGAGSPACSANICVHWARSGADAPPATDADVNGIPDQVDATLAAADTSWAKITGSLGFRAPLPDSRAARNGGDTRYDIYLADTGADKLAGYTSSDDSRLAKGSKYRFRDVSAFSVVDNDFSSTQFRNGTSQQNLEVGVAHELMHASEYAYDYREDAWLIEGTAAWVEDQVFDDANLNLTYLKHSALTTPLQSLDTGRNGFQYGSWIFLRYLSEKYGPKIVSKIWHFADDGVHQVSPKRTVTFSMAAVRRALPKKAPSLSSVYAVFVRDNLLPARRYSEGGSYPHPTAVNFQLDRKHPTTHWQGIPLDHMSAIHVSLTPSNKAPRHGRLRIAADGPDRKLDPQFRVTVEAKNGHLTDYGIKLNKHGNGSLRVPFGRASVKSVDIAMVNANPTMHGCYQHKTPFSCSGRGVDGKILQVNATIM